jgi:hypothetical protein
MTELVLSKSTSIWPFESETRAVSTYGRMLDDLLSIATRQVGRNVQDWDVQIESALAEIVAECSVDDWDGCGAKAVLPETVTITRLVANILHERVPKGTPPPDVLPESDGEIALSWTRTPDRVFSISVGDHGNLNYAGRLADGVEPHDVAEFTARDPTTIQHLALFITQLFR